ncbi:MAG: winged helix-turn-helix domain-containing protein [Betaproteobacteria bacterium]|nr:winged helix-turn-helix domain-containing protein [Betaproteobacteria bacterium]
MSTTHPTASSNEAVSSLFGPYRFEIATRSLFRANEFLPLTPKVAETLLLLLEQAGRVVTKEQLLERVWPGVVVEEGGIANNISALRKLLNDDFGEDGPIATIARRGYRFAVEVHQSSASAPAAVTPQQESPAMAPASASATDRNAILIADIENKTGDAVFDETIKQALMLNLAQSPRFDILTDRKVHSLLRMMDRAGQPVIGDVALEICQRTGTRVAITGSIFALDDDFAIGLFALDGETGDILVSEQARAKGRGEVLHALDRAALGLREKLGESLASLRRHSMSFDEVATSSLEALKAYTVGRREWLQQGEAAAMPHLLRAIELDPQFVSTYSALSLCCNNMGESANANMYMQKAFDLRDRATARERDRIQGMYHITVTGDAHRGLDALRSWHKNYPNDAAALINSGNLYSVLGQWEKALDHGERAMALETTAVDASNVALAYLALGRHAEARGLLEKTLARGFDALPLHLDAYLEAFLRGDSATMQRHVDAIVGRSGEEDFLIAAEADTAAWQGRYARARDLSRRAIESARRAGAIEMAATWQAQSALREAEVGRRDLAQAGAHAALSTMESSLQVVAVASLALARAGDTSRIAEMTAKLDRELPNHTQIQRYWLPCIRAAVALQAEDARGAIEALEPAIAMDLALPTPFESGFMYPPYLRGEALLLAGRAAEAAIEFRKLIARPGLVKNFVLFPLAHLGAAKALAASGATDEAAVARTTFLELWKDRDGEFASIASVA